VLVELALSYLGFQLKLVRNLQEITGMSLH